MNIFFSILSAAYIAGIFLLADSPVVDDVAAFNPYSLLHIPLYGILTLLLILSFLPQKKKVLNSTNSIDPTNPIDSSHSINSTDSIDSKGPINPTYSSNSTNPANSKNSSNPMNPSNYLIAGLIALVVAVADEIHQAYIPTRNASVVDVLLDVLGIILCMLIIKRIEKIRWFSKTIDFLWRTTLGK